MFRDLGCHFAPGAGKAARTWHLAAPTGASSGMLTLVTDRQSSPSVQLNTFLSRFPAEIINLAKGCLSKLRRAFPGTQQLVYDYTNSLVVSFGMSDRGYEAIVALAVFPRWVRLYFDKSLPDPKGLLAGAGSKVRSVAVKAAAELDRGDIKELIAAAIRHAGVTLDPNGKIRIVIKSEAKPKKAKKTRKAKQAKKSAGA